MGSVVGTKANAASFNMFGRLEISRPLLSRRSPPDEELQIAWKNGRRSAQADNAPPPFAPPCMHLVVENAMVVIAVVVCVLLSSCHCGRHRRGPLPAWGVRVCPWWKG